MTNNTGREWRGQHVKQKIPNYSDNHYALLLSSTTARQRIFRGN